MCFIISIIFAIIAYNFFRAGNLFVVGGSALVCCFLIFLMVKNIFYVKKIKEKK